jgi:hypothetical protein
LGDSTIQRRRTREKAIFVPASGNRRNADILVALQFRRYYEFTALSSQRYEEGVCFYANGIRIENFPSSIGELHDKTSIDEQQLQTHGANL